jgi:Uma2 family endonuclease
LVIEILSPNDSSSETQRLEQDYLDMGIPNICLLDPPTRTARVCENNA